MNADSKLRMTREQAEYVKHLRQVQHRTLRELSRICWEQWDRPDWIIAGNQIDGIELVAVAMYLLGENWGEYTLELLRALYPSDEPLPEKVSVL